MESTHARRAVAAAMSTASEFDLAVDDVIVLNDSNRLVIRLTPCDTVARVTPMTHHEGHQVSPEREVEVVRRLAQTDSPVATLDARAEPRVLVHDGFKITFWTYYEPMQSPLIPPADYAQALVRLHAGLRQIEVSTPHSMDRVAAVQQDVASRDVTPDLADADRALLANTLRELGDRSSTGTHPSSYCTASRTRGTCSAQRAGRSSSTSRTPATGPSSTTSAGCPERGRRPLSRAPTKNWSASAAASCWRSIAAYRWRRNDQHPSGRESGVAFLHVLREGPPWPALEEVSW